MGAQLYSPYGASRYNTGTLPTSIGFTGQRADSVTGLDYYNARYYDPGWESSCRWIVCRAIMWGWTRMGMWGEIPRAGLTRRAMAVMIQALRRIRPGVGIINPIRRNQEVGVARDRVGVGPRRRNQIPFRQFPETLGFILSLLLAIVAGIPNLFLQIFFVLKLLKLIMRR